MNHTSNQNKAKNDAAYKSWVSQHSPLAIKIANDARRALNKEAKAGKGKVKSIQLIKDDRLVKQSPSAFIYFNSERRASGDFKHMAFAEAARLAAKEWKALSASEKKVSHKKLEYAATAITNFGSVALPRQSCLGPRTIQGRIPNCVWYGDTVKYEKDNMSRTLNFLVLMLETPQPLL